MDPIALSTLSPAPPLRYIKLGRQNAWAEPCFERGEIHLGHREVPHEIALSGDREAIAAYLMTTGRQPAKARDFAREIVDFYTLDESAVWITFARDHLWWAQARPGVTWLGGETGAGFRMRQTLGPWRNTDLQGRPLRIDGLSTRLTKVAAYRQTLCGIEDPNYLLMKLKGEEDPMVLRGRKAIDELQAVAGEAIAGLHWADFERLIDLILARSGWQRVSELGGTQKDVDLIVEQVATQERAFVQIKSSAGQAVLDDYLARFDQSVCQRMFFICHSPRGTLRSPDRPDVHLWNREAIAERAIEAGLFSWLLDKAA
ncbi:restriction endonuclease [Microvirga pudoricolor]|uniref:restriction endonuclease n=1 Tax=Microvirga pudoricolor TaxID=2778729 RepID=UPI00194ECFFC|nr:restriction endonuclease [Microvirga pudoricolor]MBM6595331.1 restriction endonuclease [Microvirga pudoricolor]